MERLPCSRHRRQHLHGGSPPVRGPFGGGVHTSRICCCCSGSRSIARSPSCCCYSPPRSCCCSAPIKPHFSRLNRLLGQSIFKGWDRRGEGRTSRSGEGGSPERYPTIYLRVQDGGGGRRRWRGIGGAVAWGSPEKKLGTGGPRGMAGAAADRRWGVFSGRAGRRTAGRGRRGAAVWPVVAGSSGGWRLKMNRRPLISYPTATKSTDQR